MTHPELHLEPVEKFLAMLRFEQRDKVAVLVSEAELPIDLGRSGWVDFPLISPLFFTTNQITKCNWSKATQYKSLRETLAAKATARVSKRRRESRNATEEKA